MLVTFEKNGWYLKIIKINKMKTVIILGKNGKRIIDHLVKRKVELTEKLNKKAELLMKKKYDMH